MPLAKKATFVSLVELGGVVHWELLPIGHTVTAEIYCQQLQRVKDRLRRPPYTTLSRMGIILQHDGAAPHRAKLTQRKIEEFGWELLLHPAHSPDIAPSDYSFSASEDVPAW